PADAELWCEVAAVRLLAGDADGYRQACARVLELFGKTKEPRTAYLTARACVLGPNGVADRAEPVRLAEQAVAADPRVAWSLHTLGLAHYRAGQFERARLRSEDSLDRARDWTGK